MTELEAIARQAAARLGTPEQAFEILIGIISETYQLGRASARTPAQIAAWERNRRRIGGKPGRKDKTKRTRRTRAELEAIQDKGEMK